MVTPEVRKQFSVLVIPPKIALKNHVTTKVFNIPKGKAVK